MDFVRTHRRKISHPPLTPLIDVVFILIIFFMLTTSFMRIESLELVLPSAQGGGGTKQTVTHVFVDSNGDILLNKRRMKSDDFNEAITKLLKKKPDMGIMVLTAEGVDMQQLVAVMDQVYQAGGRSLMVRKWDVPKVKE